MTDSRQTSLGLRFDSNNRDAVPHTLPVTDLVRVLEGLQKIIHTVAMMEDGRDIGKRHRVPRDIKNSFQLRCRTAVEGSFHQPVLVSGSNQTTTDQKNVMRVLGTLEKIMLSLENCDWVEFEGNVPRTAYRFHILGSLEKMFKSETGRCDFVLEGISGKVIARSVSANKAISRFKKKHKDLEEKSSLRLPTAVGELYKIDIQEHKVGLRVHGTKRLLNCEYPEESEDMLVDNMKNPIQVEGVVEGDANGIPLRILKARSFNLVNTGPIELTTLVPKNLKVRKIQNTRVEIRLSDDGQLYIAEYPDLEIVQADYTRSDLVESLRAEIEFIWREYAMEKDAKLWPDAQKLKKNLLRFFREV